MDLTSATDASAVWTLPTETDPSAWCHSVQLVVDLAIVPLISAAAFISNIAMLDLVRTEIGQSATMLLLFWLTLSDTFHIIILVGVISPPALMTCLGHTAVVQSYMRFYDEYIVFFGEVFNMLSIWLTVVITWQRYIAACRPFQFTTQIGSLSLARKLVFACFVFCVVFNMPKMLERLPSGETLTPSSVTSFTMGRTYTIGYKLVLYYSVVYVIPMTSVLCMTYCLIKSLAKARRRHRDMSVMTDPHSRRNQLTISIIINVVISLVANVLPPIHRTIVTLKSNQGKSKCPDAVFIFSLTSPVMIISCGCDLFIYILVVERFRQKCRSHYQGCLKGTEVRPAQIHMLETTPAQWGIQFLASDVIKLWIFEAAAHWMTLLPSTSGVSGCCEFFYLQTNIHS